VTFVRGVKCRRSVQAVPFISLAVTTSGVNIAASIPQNVFAVEITTTLRDVVGR